MENDVHLVIYILLVVNTLHLLVIFRDVKELLVTQTLFQIHLCVCFSFQWLLRVQLVYASIPAAARLCLEAGL